MRSPPIPTTLTVVVDSREKIPILFPATLTWCPDRSAKTQEIIVKTRTDKLFAGDYCLEFPEGTYHDRTCTVERKGSASEIYNNLFTKDWDRCSRAFRRLSQIRSSVNPWSSSHYLLVEPSLAKIRKWEQDNSMPDGIMLDRLAHVASLFDLHLWMAPGYSMPAARRRLGELMIRLMLGHIFHPPLLPQTYSEDWYNEHRHAARDWKGKSDGPK
jgi:hypothetical protein